MNQKRTIPEEINFDTKTLACIVAIVDEGGLSNAAEALFLSQPALSRYLRKTEEALGTPIFERKHNRLILTNAGKVFINGARSMLHIEQEVLQSIQASKLDRHTSLTVAAQRLFAPFLQQVVQPALLASRPGISLQLEIKSADQVRSLVSDGTVDLGFFMGNPSESPYFSQECLFTSQLVFCAAADSPALSACRQEGFLLSRFAKEPMLMSLENTFLFQAQTRLLREAGILDPPICARGRLQVLLDLICLGYGNVILPREAGELPQDRIFSLPSPAEYSCIAAWCRGRPLSDPAQCFLAAAKRSFPLFSSR